MLAALFLPADAAPRHKLLVISVDGLDWRYLRDADALGLKLPNIRRLLSRSQVADGVVGVWPTVTWPSHTIDADGRAARSATASWPMPAGRWTSPKATGPPPRSRCRP